MAHQLTHDCVVCNHLASHTHKPTEAVPSSMGTSYAPVKSLYICFSGFFAQTRSLRAPHFQ